MLTFVLNTKLSAPPLGQNLVSRPSLIQRLNEGLHRKLTLISAPAGFGKTTLVMEWLRGTSYLHAWLSLDEEDNDPARFFIYLVAALQSIGQEIGQTAQVMLQSPHPSPPDMLLTSLINDIAVVPEPFVLALDDYHLIHALPIHQQLAFLIEHLPPQMHLVIASREDPPLPLARLRARGQMMDIRQVDLAFTEKETASFLQHVGRLELSPAEIAVLHQRTEGWIAGLQLVALSLCGRDDVQRLVQSFTGSHRYILDYLMEEVFQRQSPDIQDFMLKTSILDRFTAPLCDAVTRRNDSRVVLLGLEQANLFIVPLDESREWYRYHHLFADLLRHRLQIESSEDVAHLHRRASRWYTDNGSVPDAVRHALAAQDWREAASLILRISATLLKHGEVSTLLGWFRALPDEVVRADPRLCFEYSWPLLLAEQADAAESYLVQAEQAAQDRPPFLGQIATAQAYAARIKGDGRRFVELSQRALALLPSDDWVSRSVAAMNLGMAYWYAGQLAGAERVLVEAQDASWRSGNDYASVVAQVFLCRIQAARGRLRQAAASYRGVIARGGQLPPVALAHTDLAKLLYEWNELERAADHVQRALELGRRSGNMEFEVAGLRMLALIKEAQGESEAAQRALQESSRLAQNPSISVAARSYTLAYHVLVALAGDDRETASRLAERFPKLEEVASLPDYLLLSLSLARLFLAQGRKVEAAALLRTRAERASRAGWQSAVVEMRALQALAAPAPAEALDTLAEALTLAEPEGYVRTFVDLGEPMIALLRQAASRGIAPNYVGKLLKAFRKAGEAKEPVLTPAPQTLPEPLSAREGDILRLLTDGLTNEEIARALFLSVNTIKTHLKAIYGKMGVHTRREATAEARRLHLLG